MTLSQQIVTGTSLTPPVRCIRCGSYHSGSCPSFLEPVNIAGNVTLPSWDPDKMADAIKQNLPPAEWLEGVQAAMGITYADDDGSVGGDLRATFGQMVAGIPGATAEGEPSITYYGYRAQTFADGREVRTSIKRLHGTILLPTGTRYAVELTGPYGEIAATVERPTGITIVTGG